jgi:hypothetical protein
MGPCRVLTFVLSNARGRPPDVGRPNKDRVFWRVESGRRFSKLARFEPRAKSAGGGHAAQGLLALVRLLARQAAREQDGVQSARIEEGDVDEAAGTDRASFDH